MAPAAVLVWEFHVRAGCEDEFEAAYGADGAWARLFARSPAFLGTELLRDASAARRYLTLDRWREPDSFARFRAEHDADYRALDAECEHWTEAESPLGVWTSLGG